MKIEERVSQLVEEKIEDRPELFLVDVKMHPGNKLIILVDGDNGISIQDCVAISRHVGFHLEENNDIEEAYNLEVSSPGIDTPLKMLRQYQKNINRTISVKTKDGAIQEGKLAEVSAEEIKIERELKSRPGKGKKEDGELVKTIPFDQIAETKVLISFK